MKLVSERIILCLDEETKEMVEYLLAPLRALVKVPIAYTRVPLLPVDFSRHEFQSTMANLTTNAILDFVSILIGWHMRFH